MTQREARLVAVLRGGYKAYSRRDFDEACRGFHPDITLIPAGGQLPIRGLEKVRAWMEPDAFEAEVLEPLDFTIAGDKILVRLGACARGSASGIELHFREWAVWTFDADGRATQLEFYLEREEAEALEAAGLAG